MADSPGDGARNGRHISSPIFPNETSIFILVSSSLLLSRPCVLYSPYPRRFYGLACTFSTKHQELQ